ncbi:DUF6911 family protein [Pseudomonas poae]|uniref:DUF6911 family protein n=3 Tax=Pseudomonas poae TaxID=200451 RepID=UPI000A548010
MKSIISKYREVDDAASLSISPALEYGPYEINLYADSGNYLLMLNQSFEDGEHIVRTFDNASGRTSSVEILGGYYPASFVTRDISVVTSCFQEFLNFGGVSSFVLSA